MSDLGPLLYYLGSEVLQEKGGISLKQSWYVKVILEKTRMLDYNMCKSPMEPKVELSNDEYGELVDTTEYRSIIGGLRYFTNTKMDISYAIGMISRYMDHPTIKHMQVIKHILRYIKGTTDYGLAYVTFSIFG
ncbi:uncharacterized mitochondrial protein AtMg00810-like [Lactuca sativa]|uniref:uncharacterized mitochondrial protein AtMg00810-like n=1 Tax=Lactuca sativa TaxID=4236 RepID=UPI000CD86E14|nr:uncharacterized mitochondrial protein AtMg00810-like [Lactuca sativa]